jgi:CBS-domain-containing membrane protein
VAAWIGQGLAAVFAFLGLLGNPLLILIALFIFFAASAEAGHAQAREFARDYLASHAMITSFQSLSLLSTVDDAAAMLLRTTQQEFPVIDGSRALRGVVTREDLITALREKGGNTPVLDIMSQDLPTVAENAPLDRVFELLRGSGAHVVGVVDSQNRPWAISLPKPLRSL